MNSTACAAIASSEHFTYKLEAKRPWSPKTILALLEQAYHEYEKLMGPGLDTIIEVKDRVCELNNHGARTEINIQVHASEMSEADSEEDPEQEPNQNSEQAFTVEARIICNLPLNYGYTQQEQELAYHFFGHELFHCWIGGVVPNLYEPIVEAIAQYMTDWMLVHLGWCSEDILIQGRMDWQRIVRTGNLPHTLIAGYKLLFDKMHTNDPDRLFDFCRDLADCFRQQRSCAAVEISPVLQRYLGLESEEDQESDAEG